VSDSKNKYENMTFRINEYLCIRHKKTDKHTEKKNTWKMRIIFMTQLNEYLTKKCSMYKEKNE
jgi:hypothetical protein